MNRRTLLAPVCLAAAALAGVAGTLAVAQPTKEAKPGQPDHVMPQLPPGWTEADMQACMEAGTPGEMHRHLADAAGVWTGTCKMWMAPGTEPMESECTSTVTVVMDGRYTKCEMTGDMPGMGPYNGLGFYGYDNVGKKLQSTWIDNHSTGMMNGVGERSADGKTITWRYTYNCPITKKPTVMREVERMTGTDTKTLEMFGAEPKSGVEYKMMEISFTRTR